MLKKQADAATNTEIKETATKNDLTDSRAKAFMIIPAEPLLYIYGCKAKDRCPDESKIEKLAQLFEKSQYGTGNYNAEKNHTFKIGGGGYLGCHACSCGKRSSVCDYLLPGDRYFTNSLCVHYLECHYSDINEIELEKLERLLKMQE